MPDDWRLLCYMEGMGIVEGDVEVQVWMFTSANNRDLAAIVFTDCLRRRRRGFLRSVNAPSLVHLVPNVDWGLPTVAHFIFTLHNYVWYSSMTCASFHKSSVSCW